MNRSLAPAQGTAAEAAFFRLPDVGALYAGRAARLRKLAQGHAMADYLRLMASVAAAQQKAAAGLPPPAAPDAAMMRRAIENGAPPFSRTGLKLEPCWHMRLNTIIGAIDDSAAPPPAREALTALRALSFAARERLAHRFLAGDVADETVAQALFVGAALAVYWAGMMRGAAPSAFQPLFESPGLCPACGSPPSASVLESGAPGVRRLHCALCDAEWRLARLRCASCQSTANIAWLGLEGDASPMRAECCGDCGAYVKLLNRDSAPEADLVADDLATLGLDFKLAEEGMQRFGYNPFLLMR